MAEAIREAERIISAHQDQRVLVGAPGGELTPLRGLRTFSFNVEPTWPAEPPRDPGPTAFQRERMEAAMAEYEPEPGVPWCAPCRGAALSPEPEAAPAGTMAGDIAIFGENMRALGRALADVITGGIAAGMERAVAACAQMSARQDDDLQAKRERRRANRALPQRTLSKAKR